MAVREELVLDISKAQRAINGLGAQLNQVSKQFSRDFAKSIKSPTIKPIAAPKIERPVVPTPNVDAATAQLRQFAQTTKESFNNAAKSISSTFAGIALAAGAAGAASTKAFTSFELSLSRIEGLVGLSSKSVNALGKEVLALSGETTKAPVELSEALYFIVSSGIEAKDAMAVLEASAKSAAAGLGETKSVADVVTSAMNAYGKENLSASEATDILTAAVREGKGEASEFSEVIGRVLPIAAKLGVSFNEVGAATAALTLNGLDAAESTTALRQVLATLLSPTKEAHEQLATLGLSAQGLRTQLANEGLIPTLKTLAEATGDNTEAADALFGNIRALTGFLSITGANIKKTTEIFGELEDATGSTDKAFAAFKKTSQANFDAIISGSKELGIEIGTKLSPAIAGLSTIILSDLQRAINVVRSFTFEFDPATLGRIRESLRGLEPVIAGIGLAITAKLGAGIPVIGQFLGLIHPVPAILGGLALSSKEGRDALGELAKQFADLARSVGPAVVSTVRSLSATFGDTLLVVIKSLVPPIVQIIQSLSHLAADVLPPLAQAFGLIIQPVAVLAGGILSVIADVLGTIASVAEPLTPLLLGLAGAFTALKVAQIANAAITAGSNALQIYGGAAIAAGGGLKGLTSVAGSLAGGLSGLLNPAVLATGAAFTIGGLILSDWNKEQEESEKRVKDLTAALNEQDTTIEDLIDNDLQERFKEQNKVLAETGVKYDDLTGSALGFQKSQETIRKQLLDNEEVFISLNWFDRQGNAIKQTATELELAKRQYIETGVASDRFSIRESSNALKIKSGLFSAREEYQKVAEERINNLVASGRLSKAEADEAISRNEITDGATDYIEALQLVEDKVKGVTSKTELAASAADSFKSSLDRLFDDQFSLTEATIKYEEAIDNLATKLKENGAIFDVNDAKGRDNLSTLIATAKASNDVAVATVRQGQSAKDAVAGLDANAAALRKVLTDAGLSKAAIDELLTTIGLSPKQIDIKFNLLLQTEKLRKYLLDIEGLKDEQINTALTLTTEPDKLKTYLTDLNLTPDEVKTAMKILDEQALTDLRNVQNEVDKTDKKEAKPKVKAETKDFDSRNDLIKEKLRRLNGTVARPKVEAQTSKAQTDLQAILNTLNNIGRLVGFDFNFKLPGKASGGPVQAGQPYKVGEKGEELFIPKTNGVIVPNHRLRDYTTQQSVSNSTTNSRSVEINVVAKEASLDERRLAEIMRRSELLVGV